MSENNVTGIIGAEVTTTGIIGATVAIGQYIINDYVITIAEAEGDYGYTMTITRGTDTQTVTLYGLTPEQYASMLGYLEQAQAAAQAAAGSASDAAAYMEAAINAANTANTQAGRATQASDTARSYASQAQTAKQGAETAKTDAQTARTQAQGYRQAAEAAATRAETAATRAETSAEEITGMTAEAETLEPGSPATASFLDGVLSLGIPAGANGAAGNGIVSIVKTGTSGNIDTYTITYTNGTTSTFTVRNGVDGAVTSVAGKTGAVTLDAGDVAFDDQETYNDGTVGAGLTNLLSDLDEISDNYIPENYGIISASEATYPTNKAQYITVTDGQVESEVFIKNTSGVNTLILFPLNDLAYGTRTGYIVKAFFDNLAVSSVPRLCYNVTPGTSMGYTWHNLELQSDGSYSYAIDDLFARYNYTTYGPLYIGFSLRYNQTSDAIMRVVINLLGDEEKRFIKNNAISGLELSNMGTDLQKIILDGNQYPTLFEGREICTFNKGLAIGDSLTAGVFNTHDSYVTKPTFSYPAKLSQLTGIEMTNLGNGGFTSAQWYTAHASDDLSGYQFAIIQLGVNDALQNSGWTQESETAFTNIINKLLNENNGIFVFVSTIIPATSYSGTSFDSVSNGIRTLVETLNNTHVILLDMALYGNTKLLVAYNNGHLSALGYERLALDYQSYISYIMEQTPTLFRNIQFIGTTEVYP